MNRILDIGLLIVALVLVLIDSPFASVAFFAMGLFHLYQAAEGGKTSEGYRWHLVIGMFLAIVAFAGVFIAGYMDQQTIQIYEESHSE